MMSEDGEDASALPIFRIAHAFEWLMIAAVALIIGALSLVASLLILLFVDPWCGLLTPVLATYAVVAWWRATNSRFLRWKTRAALRASASFYAAALWLAHGGSRHVIVEICVYGWEEQVALPSLLGDDAWDDSLGGRFIVEYINEEREE